MVKNKKDYNILASIVENSRIPISQLAKKTRLSREVVNYRLKNLERNLIASYQARINLKFFADQVFTMYLSIPGDRSEVVAKLKILPNLYWLGNCGGRWNYIITFGVNLECSLADFFDRLFLSFENQTIGYSLTQHLREYSDSCGGLFGNREIFLSEKETNKKIKLDDLDKKIIKELVKNARNSNSEIAEKLKTTRETVRLRIKQLEKHGIILNYRTMIRPEALELETYILAIRLNSLNTEKIEPLALFFSSLPGCSYVCVTAGEINIIVTISLKSLKELDEVSLEARKKFPEIIKEIEPLPLFSIGDQRYSI